MKTNNSPVSDNEKLIVPSKSAVEDVSLKFRVAAYGAPFVKKMI